MAIPSSIVKRLYAKSGNRCAYPNCMETLIIDELNQSEMAHIISSRPEGPRHISNFNSGNYDVEDNIVVLCVKHHNEVDINAAAFPVEKLKNMKAMHELEIEKLLSPRNVNQEFIINFLAICQKNKIYEVLSYDFITPYPEVMLEYGENCCNELGELLQSKTTITLDRTILSEAEHFKIVLENMIQCAAMFSHPTGNGYTMPKLPQDISAQQESKNAINENRRILCEIFSKYRYG